MVTEQITAYRLAAAAAERVPVALAGRLLQSGGKAASFFAGDRRVMVERNLRRVHGHDLADAELNRAVAATFASYTRYYHETFRLPSVSDRELDERFDYVGFDHIARAAGTEAGPILVLPHLGGWEWAAFWLSRIPKIKVTAIVEPLDPPEIFDWFRSLRESLGMRVEAVGPEGAQAAIDGIRDGHAVCLLADRAVSEASSVPVDFLGERTLLPAGPATLALRTGAPLVPVAVYHRGDRYFAECRPPVAAEREGKFRDDAQRVTQNLARELERFIRAAPEQWHLLQPNWPSDFRALGRPIPDRYRVL